jgi:predicted alpha/beta-hydrolase family hydrolase
MEKIHVSLESERGKSSGELILPENSRKTGIVLAHGAGGNMMDRFIRHFHEQLAAASYPSLKFNFLYSEARRKVPDSQSVLMSTFAKAIESMPVKKVVIGGKSMGGRIASYLADREEVIGLFFLGYPLHPPGKTEQLRDAHLYSIRKPMFFASGTKDPFAQSELLNKTLKKIGTFATTHLVAGGGHSFDLPKKSGISQEETNKAVAGALIQWLDRITQEV